MEMHHDLVKEYGLHFTFSLPSVFLLSPVRSPQSAFYAYPISPETKISALDS